MIDLGLTKLALIGGIALLVLGPEKLPRAARTLGTLFGRVQRYAADVRAEVSRSIALEDLKKMRTQVQAAGREFEQAVQGGGAELQSAWTPADLSIPLKRRKKNWRLKRSAIPHWYKARAAVRNQALSGAARVARFRPRRTAL